MNPNLIDRDFARFTRSFAEIKQYFFDFILVLTREDETSFILTYLISLIMGLQLIFYAFHGLIGTVWQETTITSNLEMILGVFHLSFYLKKTSWSVFSFIIYVPIIAIAIKFMGVSYLTYLSRNQKNPSGFLVKPMRYLWNLTYTVLFIPICDIMVTVLDCKTYNDGSLRNKTYQTVVCWQGGHIFSGTFAIITLVVMVLLGFPFVATNFDSIGSDNSARTRKSHRNFLVLLMYQILLVFLFEFLDEKQHTIILIIVMGVFSSYIFHKFKTESPFYHEGLEKFWQVITTVNIWTVILVIFAYIVEGIIFKGTLYTWFFCLPLIVLIKVSLRENELKPLLKNTTKLRSPQDYESIIYSLYRLIQIDIEKAQDGKLIYGFISIHKQICQQEACPLTKFNISSSKSVRINRTMKGESRHQVIYEFMNRLFTTGISKFPKSVSMRIAYAIFLIRVRQYKQLALKELEQALSYQPYFDEQFVIHQIKKNVEGEIAEINSRELDFTEQKEYEEYFQSFKSALEKSVLFLMEFWFQLSDDKPDITKLYDIGNKMSHIKKVIDEYWKRVSRVKNYNLIKAKRLFARYLIDIFNHREEGVELIEQARKLENLFRSRKDIKLMGIGENINIENQEEGTICMSLEDSKFSIIYAINTTGALMFGYTKNEVLNNKVNMLMPGVFARNHDGILRNYQDTNVARLNKDRQLFGKQKSGFIFPFIINVKPLNQFLKQGIEFVASLKPVKNVKEIGYLMMDPEGTLEDISSTILNMLGIDLKYIKKKKININDLFPDFMQEKEKFLVKHGCSLTFNPSDVKSIQKEEGKRQLDSFHTDENLDFNISGPKTFQAFLSEINFGLISNAGFVLKLEPVITEEERAEIEKSNRSSELTGYAEMINNPLVSPSVMTPDSRTNLLITPHSNLRTLKRKRSLITGTHREHPFSLFHSSYELLNSSIIAGDQVSILNSSFQNDGEATYIEGSKRIEADNKNVSASNLGQGIKTYRMMNNQLYELEKLQEEEDEEEEDEAGGKKKSIFAQDDGSNNENDDYGSGLGDGESFLKSQKSYISVINKESEARSIKNLKKVSCLMLFVLIILATLAYFLKIERIDSMRDSIDLLSFQSQQMGNFQVLNLKVRELTFLSKNFTFWSPTYDADLRKDIASILLDIDATSQKIQFSPLYYLAQRGAVPIYQVESKQYLNYNLNEASEQIFSKAMKIQATPLNDVALEVNDDVKFILYNTLNDFYMTLNNIYDGIYKDMLERNQARQDISLIVLVVSAILILILSILNTIFIQRTLVTKIMILSVFLEIPERTAKRLYSKCEFFLANLSSGAEDDAQSDAGEFADDRTEGREDFVKKSKRKRFKNMQSSSFNFVFFVKMIIFGLLIEGYFLLDYFLGAQYSSKISTIGPEVNATFFAESYYELYTNAEKLLFYTTEIPTFKMDTLKFIEDNFLKLYENEATIQREHSFNSDIHLENYKHNYDMLRFIDPCSILDGLGSITEEECREFSFGNLAQGLTNMINHNFMHFNLFLNMYKMFKADPNYTIQIDGYINFTDNLQTNNIYNLMKIDDNPEFDSSLLKGIKPGFRLLVTSIVGELQSFLDSFVQERIILLIVFLLVFFLSFFLIWLPFLSRLNKDIWATRSLIGIIPLNEIVKYRNIHAFIRRYIIEQRI